MSELEDDLKTYVELSETQAKQLDLLNAELRTHERTISDQRSRVHRLEGTVKHLMKALAEYAAVQLEEY